MRRFSWLGILFTPFRRPQIKVYIGKITMTTPYFLPRKSRRLTKKEAMMEALKHKQIYPEKNRDKLISQIYKERLRLGRKYVDIKYFGINLVDLGWKYKWDSVRHEWNPMLSLIFLGLQLHISIGLKDFMSNMCYWEAWLTYKGIKETSDCHMSEEFFISETINKYSAMWTFRDGNKEIKTNYWHDILKEKYKYLIHGERVEIITNNE